MKSVLKNKLFLLCMAGLICFNFGCFEDDEEETFSGNIQVINSTTKYTIDEVYIVPSTSPVWGSDLLTGTIIVGSSQTFPLTLSAASESYDVQVCVTVGGCLDDSVIVENGKTSTFTLFN